MKLAYIAPYTPIPSRLASSLHIMKMCSSYSKIPRVNVTLFISKDREYPKMFNIFKFYSLDKEFEISRYSYIKTGFFRLFHFFIYFPFLAKIKKMNFVHTRNLSIAFGTSVLLRIPTILELHDSPGSNKKISWIFKICVKSKYLKSVIVITEALKNHMILNFPYLSNKIIVLPDGVSEKNLDVNLSREQARKFLDLDFTFSCIYTGHLYRGRGIDFIISLAEALTEINFIIVGGNDADVKFYKQKTLNLQNVKFVGFVEQEIVLFYHKAADVLLMPYENEVFVAGTRNNSTAPFASPLKMFEYMAAERPIISSQLPVLYEILTDGEDALMLPYGERRIWTEAISKIKEQPLLGQLLGENAKKNALNYTWESRAKKIVDKVIFL